MTDDEVRHITEAEYRAALPGRLARIAEDITALLPQEARDAGMRFEWDKPDRPYCLPGCDRLDGHDGRDAGACMGDGGVLKPGPLDLVHHHPDIPVHVPVRRVLGKPGVYEGDLGPIKESGVLAYDMVLPEWPDNAAAWAPFRELHHKGDVDPPCYRTASGLTVHVKPDCRCC